MSRALAVAGLLLLAGCAPSGQTADQPAPVPAETVALPYQYGSGYSTRCDHGNRIYFSTTGAIAVVSADPSCRPEGDP